MRRKNYIVRMDSRLVDTKEFHEFVFMLEPIHFTREASPMEDIFSVCGDAQKFYVTYSETYELTVTRDQLFELKLKYPSKFTFKEVLTYD